MPKVFWFLILIASGCATEVTSELLSCDIEVDVQDEDVLAGEALILTGRPFTAMLDTSVRFDDVDASITGVERVDCTLCDACRAEAECAACESCSACASSCETCEESISITVPELPTGEYVVVVRNGYGMSTPTNMTVINLSDSDPDSPSD
jgi:hypothetical protein